MNFHDIHSAAAWQILQNTLWTSALLLPLALFWRLLPVWWRFSLGTVVLLRLLLPVTPESSWSAAVLLEREPVKAPVAAPAVPVFPVRETDFTALNSADSGGLKISDAAGPERKAEAWNPAAVLPAVWLGGVLLSGGWLLGHQLWFTRWRRRHSVPAEPQWLAELEHCRQAMGLRRTVRLWRVEGLRTPLACGIFRPCILLPAELALHLTTAEIRHVLRHELAHHRAHDLAGNVLFAAARVLHWFNPLVHFALRELLAQREILRDADAVRAAPAAEAAGYAETLLKLLRAPRVNRFQTPALTSGFLPGIRHLKHRIAMIPSISQRPRFTARLALAGAAALLAATTFTKAQEAAPEKKADPAEQTEAVPSPPSLPDSDHASQGIVFKMQNIRIPWMKMEDASVKEALEFLRIKSAQLDPEKKGVNFLLQGAGKETVTCDLRDIPLIDAVNAICDVGNHRYRLEPRVVVIAHKSAEDPLQTRIFRTPPGFAEMTNWTPNKTENYLNHLGNAAGIEFPEGSAASLNPGMTRLTVRAPLRSLDGLELYLDEAFKMPRSINLFLTEKGISVTTDGQTSLMQEAEVKAYLEAAVKKADARFVPKVIIWTDDAVQITEAVKLMVTARSAGIQAITVQSSKAAVE